MGLGFASVCTGIAAAAGSSGTVAAGGGELVAGGAGIGCGAGVDMTGGMASLRSERVSDVTPVSIGAVLTVGLAWFGR